MCICVRARGYMCVCMFMCIRVGMHMCMCDCPYVYIYIYTHGYLYMFRGGSQKRWSKSVTKVVQKVCLFLDHHTKVWWSKNKLYTNENTLPPNFRATFEIWTPPHYTRWSYHSTHLSQSATVFFLKAGCWLAIFCVYMEIIPEKYQLNISKYIIFAFYMSYILW